MTVVLGDRVTTTLAGITIDLIADAPATPGFADFTSTVGAGTASMPTIVDDANGIASDLNSITVEVIQTQGQVLQLTKGAGSSEVLVGEPVTYTIEIRNTVDYDVVGVTIADTLPASFRYLDDTALLDGAPIADPVGNRPMVFDIGTVPALVDGNGNGTADPGEPGYMLLTYQVVVGSGAVPGNHQNTAVAIDFCDTCVISNTTTADVEIVMDPLFDLGLIIGKVYQDLNRNEWQDPGEAGVPGAMVALDDGTYVLTDEHGRFHFPAVKPGQRMLKVNLDSVPGSSAATDPSRVAWVTPGLMVRINFGILVERELEGIGQPAVPGLRVAGESVELPLDLRADPDTMELIVNGERVTLPAGDVQLGLTRLEDSVDLAGGEDRSVGFRVDTLPDREITDWRVTVLDDAGEPFRVLTGEGRPAEVVEWDGLADDGREIAPGEIYHYRLDLRFADGSESTSATRRFGVNRSQVVTLSFNADAFEFDRSTLTDRAKTILAAAAEVLRDLPDEPVAIEGHTDSVGTRAYNQGLSKRRATAVLRYLVDELGLPEERFVVAWFGEESPIASNATPEGRAQNRRVEMRTERPEVEKARLAPATPVTPSVRINGTELKPTRDGRLATQVAADDTAPREMAIEVRGADGRSARMTVAVPRIELTSPRGEFLLAVGSRAHGCASDGAADASLVCRIEGRTDAGNTVQLDGRPVQVASDGSFALDYR
jgi:uncharacterized repeat protein (TIGR01451 family)